MPRKVLPLTLLCLLVFAAGGDARAAAHDVRAPNAKDLKRADAILSKLRRLEEAARAREPSALRKAASGTYPSLFAALSKLQDSDLKTDLSTAASLYDAAARDAGGRDAIDCSNEMRDSYSRLCMASSSQGGAGRAGLLAARARLHARWAEAELRYARGGRDDATLDTLSVVRAERLTDIALAEEALRALKELTGVSADEDSLEEAGRIIASLPRGRLYALLQNALDASRDALYWQRKSLPSRALVVDLNSYASPDPLRLSDTRADDADSAALGNRRAALKFIRSAEEVINASLR